MHTASRFLCTIITAACTTHAVAETEKADPPIEATIRKQAEKLDAFVTSRLARDFLKAAKHLPEQTPRIVYRNEDKSEYWSEHAVQQLPADQRDKLEKLELPQRFYYTTRFGTPMAYCRAIDLAAGAGFTSVEGIRILDFGYGGIGHLRTLASLGADVTGVEVYAILPALYDNPGDRGLIQGPNGKTGHLSLVQGRWPGEFNARSSVGSGFDLFMSKNTLKNGYVNPEKEVDPRMLIDLGVPPEQFARAVHAVLNPGGLFVIYNLCPPPNEEGKDYIPWADGRCPWSKDLLKSIGFEIVAFDVVDNDKARQMGKLLGWDDRDPPMDVDNTLFSMYTILRKPN